jgi:IS5 family transposase
MAEIATPMFGYKSHIGIDQRHGFIRTWGASDAARYDGRELPNLIDPTNTGSAIWADTAYRSQKNERAILRAGRVSKIHFRRTPGKPLPTQRQRANAARSKVRSAVEHVFATQNTAWACSSARLASSGPGKDRSRQHRVQLQTLHLLGNSSKHRMIAPPT